MSRKLNDQELVRLDKLNRLIESNQNPYEVTKVDNTHNSKTFKEEFEKYSKEELSSLKLKQPITVSGRVMGIRRTFILIQDFYSEFQLYINKNNQPDVFKYFQEYLDLGDIVTATGRPMKTNTNELSLDIDSLKIISKSLRIPPEKFHGIADEEIRSRKRYLDLIHNEESRKRFVYRSRIITAMRQFFNEKGFLEVETPFLHAQVGGAAAKPFITHYNALDRDYYLRIAPELPLKKVIVGGFDKIFEIGKCFRNEGMDSTHNPEFTSMETYVAYADYVYMMELTESIIKYVAKAVDVSSTTFNDQTVDWTKPFHRIKMTDLIKKHTGIDFTQVKTLDEALKLANEHKVHVKEHEKTIGHITSLFFEEFCEKKLIEPTFVTHHPVEISPLSKLDYSDTRYTERFELFVFGRELANAFSELNDPIDQRQRFEKQLEEKQKGNDEASEMDEDFLEALENGLPPTGGLGIGIDRLVMMLTGTASIRDILIFPHLREE
ncbi:lysine--tRNA ligase [Mycoplasma sp. E35C]|uniref:lysine--tRNA ligase n=1 Tax=Mycoplasma sp. E35C TaxID=2801918 RepID=UPI001CA41DE6|nr:lysine--tRNA ligase [Mycoplasma sp. E35C]QZX49210.1 lysine--tRNA ligase [Mycoplasma sp. E35C]